MTLEPSRRRRYEQKVSFIVERIENLPTRDLSPLERDGIYYRIITAIDASMDILAMLLKDLGMDVHDDYNNIQSLTDAGWITAEMGISLKQCNGLRNALVHKYNGIEDRNVFDSTNEIKSAMNLWINKVEEIVHGFDKNQKRPGKS